MKRKKRLQKGIKSIKEQINLHVEKKEIAKKKGKVELAGYYNKEIEKLEETKEKKEKQMER
ncbi:hypothetical protein J4433_03445 [Candidatus Pacearchaeota archaeon]|nr:hypothetical protein [Candidatus Pacearchaeota archaeon]